jgi:hypothetical protein
MRSGQLLVASLGTYGRIFETPIDQKDLRDRPPRRIDAEVAAWRNGKRATNPSSDAYRGGRGTIFTEVNGPCLSLINQ